MEAFGQTTAEVMACGTLIVAFLTTCYLDVVRDLETGY